MALSALVIVSERINLTGDDAIYELCASERYRQIGSQELLNESLAFNISSAGVYPADGHGCALVLMSSISDYEGQFLQMSTLGSSLTDKDFSAQGFDNATSSLLVIGTNRGTETRLSFRTIFLADWNSYLGGALAGSDAVANGDPLLTWKMFPSSSSVPLDPDLTYLHIFQPLVVSVHVGPLITYHYDAAIGYYLFLYVDAAHQLKAFVAGYEVWVAGGFYHDAIVNGLTPKVAAGVATLDGLLTGKLAPLSGVALQDVYYLPGDQTGTVPPIFTGDTFDDITIVAEHA